MQSKSKKLFKLMQTAWL